MSKWTSVVAAFVVSVCVTEHIYRITSVTETGDLIHHRQATVIERSCSLLVEKAADKQRNILGVFF